MAVLGDRGTGVLDMLIEGLRREGQNIATPNMSPVGATQLERTLNRPETRLSAYGTMTTQAPAIGSPIYQASQTPLMADMTRGRVLDVNDPMRQMPEPMPVQQVIQREQARRGVPAAPQQAADPMGMQKLASDADRLVKAGAAESTDPTIVQRIQDVFGGRENMLRLAMAFNTMRLQPDAQLTAALSKQLENVSVSSRAQQIAQALRAKGTPAAISAADYIERTGDYKGGYKMFRESGKVVTMSGADLNKREGTTAYDENAMYNVNTVTGQKSAIGGGGVSVNIGPEEGSLSTDYTFLRDAEGNPIYKNGLPVAVPVPGSPAAQKAEEAKEKETGRSVQRERAGGTVIQDIQRGLDLIPQLSGIESMSGVAGANARKIAQEIEGTVSNRIFKFKESALSNVGLDILQQMRENSPTGGALGQVPIQQQQRLEQVLGSLDVTQELPVLEQNMKRVINIYLDIVYGAESERQRLMEKGELSAEENAKINSYYYDLPFDVTGRPTDIPPKPDDIPQKVWDAMKDDEKRAF